MIPSSPAFRTLKRPRSQPRIHRGDVSSSATSSSDEGDGDMTPKRAATAMATPKRKVVGSMLPVSTGARTRKIQEIQYKGLSVMSPSTGLKPRVKIGDVKDDKVNVCVRVKPTQSSFSKTAYNLTSNSLTLTESHPNVIRRGGKAMGREDEYIYMFDNLIEHPSTTEELYRSNVSPLVDKAMSGFNATVFAYGQTGSGKSYTMTGVPTELGIIPCAVDGVFDAINEELDRAYLLRVSYVEIYNETLRDLLDFDGRSGKPVISSSKGQVYVEPLIEKVVSTPHEIMELLERGNASRKVGQTDWNERSSRSHSVFTITIESRPQTGAGDVRRSRLSLIDLAGSEKAVSDTQRRSEGKHINQSLLALREVINKLSDKKRPHIPYRDSKLTHLLENALGGESNICVICTISADQEHASETLETLKFAGRCSQVETKAKKNILMSDEKALIRAKDKEIEDLKRRLEEVMNDSVSRIATSDGSSQSAIGAELAESVAAMEARKAKLAEQLAKLNAQILTSEAHQPQTVPQRRRISDNYKHLMSPRQGTHDRRAVSSMIRVPEEGEGLISFNANTDPFDVEKTVATLRRTLVVKEGELATVQTQLETLSRSVEEAANKIQTLELQIRDLTDENTALTKANAYLGSELDTRLRDSHEQLETSRNDLLNKVNEKVARIEELEMIISELRSSRQQLVMADQDEIEKLQRRLNAVQSEAESMKADHAAHLANLNQEIADRLEKSRVAHEAATAQALDTEARLTSARGDYDRLGSDYKTLELRAAESQTKYDALRERYDQEIEVLQLRIVEKDEQLKTDSKTISNLTLDNAGLQRALDKAREETLQARRGHLSSASEPRLANLDLIESLRTQAIRQTSTGNEDNRLRTMEREEIDRLEKIVELQKGLIDEQREKIKYWADAMEKQKKIVEMLTGEEIDTSTFKSITSPSSRSTKGSGGGLKSSLPSTFTAFNLALPSAPTPLPAHPAQQSNSSARKGRRITIEHDIETLGESHKVNMTKSRFDIPGELPPSPSKPSLYTTPSKLRRMG
ncbi:kinesin motor domain-domain-containing protein [Kockovaella imperatae]|uniref:Kinesin motor domain-domain-containing protein n=1 Tax=Kockovaella imperatae TaxID=4999 RepID=A0A1Y1UIM4_9TREE|nr:kinesin motor domain-domain-containing protein [Kockovaella imperatae]ORX37881.1 kinesin motor domain-domain-containing protein [Kockovaella imperatae]